jgi:hypothetical protein
MNRAQITLAGMGFAKYTKTTRRAQFLAEMARVVPMMLLGAEMGHASVLSRELAKPSLSA